MHSFICGIYLFLSQFSSLHRAVLNRWPVLFSFSPNCSDSDISCRTRLLLGVFRYFCLSATVFISYLLRRALSLGVDLSVSGLLFSTFSTLCLHVCAGSEEMPVLIPTSTAWRSRSFLNRWFALCHRPEEFSVLITSTFLVFLSVFSRGRGRKLWHLHSLIKGSNPIA